MLGRRQKRRPKSYSSARCRGLRVGAMFQSLVVVLLLAGCGSTPEDASKERAAEIEERAMQAENEAARAERDRTQTEQTAPAQAGTTVTVPEDDLPAGSEEIDGSQGESTSSDSGGTALIDEDDRSSFRQLQAKVLGGEGVVITTLRGSPIVRLGDVTGGVAWSTAKAPVAMAAIAAGTAKESDLRLAITASDNAAAERLWSGLGGGTTAANAATAQLRSAGDGTTVVESERLRNGYTAFGQTSWRLTDQARFVAGMACSDEGMRVLSLMGEVTASQRWGLGSTGAPARFKGGWGPGVTAGSGDGWLERQMGILTVSGRPIVVAIASTGPGHEADTIALTQLAKWVIEHVNARSAPMQPDC